MNSQPLLAGYGKNASLAASALAGSCEEPLNVAGIFGI